MNKKNYIKNSWCQFNVNRDQRGNLTAIEENVDIPISINRIFYMTNIVQNRGGHAHIETDQVIIAINGNFKVALFDGLEKETFYLDNSEKGIYIPRLTYTDLYDFSNDAICLVLANSKYDMNKSLRSLDQFIDYLKLIINE